MQPGNINQYAKLSEFRDLKNFNDHIEMWMIDVKELFTKAELVALKRLIRYCSKFPGVSNAKIHTIVAATHKDDTGISRSSFERMLRKAKKFDMIDVNNTFSKGKQCHNVYVFQPYPSQDEKGNVNSQQADVLNGEKIDGAKASNLYKTSNKKDINKRKIDDHITNQSECIKVNKEPKELTAEFTSERVPSEFTKLASCFWSSAKTIESLWQRVEICAYKNVYENEHNIKLDIGMHSLRQAIRAIKIGKVRDFKGYMYGIMRKKFQECYFEELYDYDGAGKNVAV
ncbi:TPA: hypothetical protein ACGXMH_001364 [Bacillus mobilis]|uniref:hypothetical protein n=1 Tax=Bacillus mobilis TaxID=2026190 RepID=UPI0011A59EA1|nr:hypothetical protein [Bacillus mobilis]MED4385022.1 hypothetical protein [Bacillus mobilis]HDX9638958.1 hypothetical protein [Bacillus mobilis]